METVIPHVMCLATEDEYAELASSIFYPEVYVETKAAPGFIRHIKLSNKRHVKIPVGFKDLPKEVVKVLEDREIESDVTEINFLPGGKIPSYFLSRIVAFFREVMKLRKSEVEAHAWIVWNPTDGYHIVVPKQTVTKASVSFEYTETQKPGDIIVVDIH